MKKYNTREHLPNSKRYKILISSLHSIYRLINSTFELDDLMSRLTRLTCQIFNARYCLLFLVDPTKKYSILKCEVTYGKKNIIDKKKKLLNGIGRKIVKIPTSILDDKILGIPLVYDDVIGAIIIKRNRVDSPFNKFDKEILNTVTEQAIIGIRNLQLYEEQQRVVLGSIKSMVTLLDARIPREYTHSSYFSRLVAAIGHQMHLDEKQIESLKYASSLHDAGKIDIPLEILTKTTKLTPKEYKIIKRHPVRGAQILRHLQILKLKPVIPIILHHHEKYNGTGYPSRLKKGQIPQGARIMAVADACEAMVYGRPYRERKNINYALKEIKKKIGRQFDPKVVEAFLKVIKKRAIKKYLQARK